MSIACGTRADIEFRSSFIKEYQRTYNRLKQRKTRRKISVDEWNIAVAKAQELLTQAEQGMLADEVLKKKLAEL